MAEPSPPPLTGPALPLPERLDRVSERWARLPWRARTLIILMALSGLVLIHIIRVNDAKGVASAMQSVWVANETIVPGAPAERQFSRIQLPSRAVPPLAVSEEPSTSPVLTIVAGTVATSAHFDGVEKAPAIPAGYRAVALSINDADLYAPGTQVDLWDTNADPPRVLLERLLVVQVKAERVIIGVPENHAGSVIQLISSNHLRMTPAGDRDQTRSSDALEQATSDPPVPSPFQSDLPSSATTPVAPSKSASPSQSQHRRSAQGSRTLQVTIHHRHARMGNRRRQVNDPWSHRTQRSRAAKQARWIPRGIHGWEQGVADQPVLWQTAGVQMVFKNSQLARPPPKRLTRLVLSL